MTYRFLTVDDHGAEPDPGAPWAPRHRVHEHTHQSLVVSTATGVFRTDPRALTERFFDMHLATSPWGTHEVVFKWPVPVAGVGPVTGAVSGAAPVSRPVSGPGGSGTDPHRLTASLVERYGGEAWTVGGHFLIALRTDFAGSAQTPHFPLGRLASVRAGLASGDRRALYLGWLALLGRPELYGPGELRELEHETEPPVPQGLGALDSGLRLLARILCVHPRLLSSAAAAEPARPRSVASLLRAATDLPESGADSRQFPQTSGRGPSYDVASKEQRKETHMPIESLSWGQPTR
ncbi:hypothetical protein [Streptomyces sp. NPDC048560]|uniref:hypothetical protein n=1 Tax=Streptomyces sp. NPDC048560 TaxID=3155488 RepID=UPI00342A4A75